MKGGSRGIPVKHIGVLSMPTGECLAIVARIALCNERLDNPMPLEGKIVSVLFAALLVFLGFAVLLNILGMDLVSHDVRRFLAQYGKNLLRLVFVGSCVMLSLYIYRRVTRT
jgi:hypothetical protein